MGKAPLYRGPLSFFLLISSLYSTIDVNEWVAVAGLTAKGSVGDRLAGTSWCVVARVVGICADGALRVASFRMFDEDGNGELSVAEVEAMFMRIAKVAEGGVLSDDTKADTKEVIRQIFLRFDTDKVPRASLPLHNANPSSPASSRFLVQQPQPERVALAGRVPGRLCRRSGHLPLLQAVLNDVGAATHPGAQ